MGLDTSIPARFLTSAYRDDDLIVIAYRCLAHRPVSQQSRLPDDTAIASTVTSSKDAAAVIQKQQRPIWHHRFVTAARARSPRYLAWLRHLNAAGNDIYVSMNTFVSREGGRTEANVHAIRHVYADFDKDGAKALVALRARRDLPPPSYVIHSSRGKFQAVWNVTDFEPAYAKRLLCHLAYTLGADRAVHDLNRVLRLPGFFNLKYSKRQFVRLDMGNDLGPHGPSSFPVPTDTSLQLIPRVPRDHAERPRRPGQVLSRSERDWADVRSALSMGTPWREVWKALVLARPDKADPSYYATLTVSKALISLGRPQPPELAAAVDRSGLRSTRR
jgi:hypothetical protein